MTQKEDRIPFPEYEAQSRFHKRCKIPEIPLEQRKEWWSQQDKGQRLFDYLISKLIKFLRLYKGNRPHILYKFVQRFFFIYLKLQNQLKIYGKENLPKNGSIFYLNHPGAYDPLILTASLPYENGAIIAWNYSWFMHMINYYFGYITKIRYETRQIIVERMVRQILTRNRNFAIWPEGSPDGTGLVREPFTSVVDLYATINYKEDILPLTPVLIRGGGVYLNKPGIHRGPIEIHFLKPFFIDRNWLKPYNEGGKTAREIANWMMMILAKMQKQPRLGINRALENRRSRFKIDKSSKPFLQRYQKHHKNHIKYYMQHQNNRSFNNVYKIILAQEDYFKIDQSVEVKTLKNYVSDPSKIYKSPEFHQLYYLLYKYRCKCSKKKGFLQLNEHKIIIEDQSVYDMLVGYCNKCLKKHTIINNSTIYSKPIIDEINKNTEKK